MQTGCNWKNNIQKSQYLNHKCMTGFPLFFSYKIPYLFQTLFKTNIIVFHNHLFVITIFSDHPTLIREKSVSDDNSTFSYPNPSNSRLYRPGQMSFEIPTFFRLPDPVRALVQERLYSCLLRGPRYCVKWQNS